MEDTTTLRLIFLHSSSSQVSVSRHKQWGGQHVCCKNVLGHPQQRYPWSCWHPCQMCAEYQQRFRGIPGAEDQNRSKVLVWVPITVMDTWTLVVELNSVCSCLDEGESGDLGLESLELIPHNLVFLSESVDSINHLLGKLILRVSQFVLVWDSLGWPD